MYKSSSKNTWTLILIILAGIVLGGFIGEYLSKVPYLGWLKYGKEFGLTSPLVLDLGVLKLQFAMAIKFTVAGIIGIIISIFAYKKM